MKKFIVITLLIFWAGHTYAQDPILSMNNFKSTYLNPANTFNPINGYTKLEASLQYRDQWNSLNQGDTYSTFIAQADYNFYNSDIDGWNAGILFFNDRSSTALLKRSYVQMQTSYTRKFNGGRGIIGQYLTAGVSYGFAQINADINNVWFGRQFNLTSKEIDITLDPGESGILAAYDYNDLTVGLKWENYLDDNNFYKVGFSLAHFNSPTLETVNIDHTIATRYTLQAEASFELSESFNHLPSLLFVKHYSFWQFVPAYNISIDIDNDENPFAVVAGLGTRIVNGFETTMVDVVLLNIGLDSNNWNFRFNFDINVSSLQEYTNGSGAIELKLGFAIVNED